MLDLVLVGFDVFVPELGPYQVFQGADSTVEVRMLNPDPYPFPVLASLV